MTLELQHLDGKGWYPRENLESLLNESVFELGLEYVLRWGKCIRRLLSLQME